MPRRQRNGYEETRRYSPGFGVKRTRADGADRPGGDLVGSARIHVQVLNGVLRQEGSGGQAAGDLVQVGADSGDELIPPAGNLGPAGRAQGEDDAFAVILETGVRGNFHAGAKGQGHGLGGDVGDTFRGDGGSGAFMGRSSSLVSISTARRQYGRGGIRF